MVKGKERMILAIMIGFILSILAFYLRSGVRGMSPHLERYATFMTIPSCFLLTACLIQIRGIRFGKAMSLFFTFGFSFFLLASFTYHYFIRIQRGETVKQPKYFQTGPIEPKQAVLKVIEQKRNTSKKTVLLTEDWWSYWPLRYLLEAKHNYHITIMDRFWHSAHWLAKFPDDYVLPLLNHDEIEIFVIGYHNGKLEQKYSNSDQVKEKISVSGYPAQPIMIIFLLRELN